MFRARYPLGRLRPAPYNPRVIDARACAALRQSIRRIGVVKPIIARDTGTVIAGHQRLRQLTALGRALGPVYVAQGITDTDEARFNQLHNVTEDAPGLWARVPPDPRMGVFVDVPAWRIKGAFRGPDAVTRATIGALICRYGPWGCAVATRDGRVIDGINYALTCAVMGLPCRTIRVPDYAARYLHRAYGAFSFGPLAGDTWRQSACQRPRLRTGGQRACRSRLYERHVLPQLGPGERLIDFGAGQADYVRRLQGCGHPVVWVEFFPLDGTRLDRPTAHAWCRDALAAWAARGPFDVVVCDSVLNSVDSVAAERDVMVTLNALCRVGGRVHVSGRTRERLHAMERTTKQANPKQYLHAGAVDADGFVALYRGDLEAAPTAWTFQKFHAASEARGLIETFIGPVQRFTRSTTSWQATAVKTVDLDPATVEAALRREFDLPWPDGDRVGLAEAAVRAWRAAATPARP
ncbi:ParB N-terminal domain-containing protein [Roseospira goensis]|uniref:ParB family chromosome partitioning protein n=1 Tax=Roseospira goensis TaxID=391922 RepID=A0A7W6S3E0_9PROT|nr:ParB N-terminal domain-containing protein [Roseospira goensis]MBB4287650.1 ParB family chromosome partitioning protein [Roseospira goensis]